MNSPLWTLLLCTSWLGAKQPREQEHLGGLPPAADESLRPVADDIDGRLHRERVDEPTAMAARQTAPRYSAGRLNVDDGDVVKVGSGKSGSTSEAPVGMGMERPRGEVCARLNGGADLNDTNAGKGTIEAVRGGQEHRRRQRGAGADADEARHAWNELDGHADVRVAAAVRLPVGDGQDRHGRCQQRCREETCGDCLSMRRLPDIARVWTGKGPMVAACYTSLRGREEQRSWLCCGLVSSRLE